MMPILVTDQAPVLPPSYHRAQGQRERWLHIPRIAQRDVASSEPA
jgi:hypothetical protein